MPSTRSKAGGGGCGCGAAVAVLRAGVVDEVVQKVRSAWSALDDERVDYYGVDVHVQRVSIYYRWRRHGGGWCGGVEVRREYG